MFFRGVNLSGFQQGLALLFVPEVRLLFLKTLRVLHIERAFGLVPLFAHFNSFMTAKPNFVLSGTIFSVAVAFFQRPKSKFWHLDKIDL